MTQTKTITFTKEQIDKILNVLKDSRPELAEDAKITNEIIRIFSMAPFNEGR